MKWQLKLIFRSLHLYWYEREVHRHLNPGEFNHPPETADYLVMEVSTNADVKAISSSFEANAGATVGASFLKSPSVAGAPEEETRETQETHQADEIPFQSEKGMLKDKIFTVAEETGSKENEVSCETEEAAEKEERSHEISDATKLKTNKEASILEASSALHTSEDLDTIVETQRNPCLNNEEKCPRLAQPIEKIESENEGIRHYEIEQTSSIVAASPDNQNDKEASLTIIENVEEKLDIPSVTLTRDKSSTPEPGVEAEDKLEENFNIASKVESQDIKMSDENDMTSLLEETEEKSHVEIPSAPQCEEMYLQELGKTEISKAASEICPEDAVRRSQEEECDIQIIERTLEAKSRGAEEVKDEMSPEQKLDILLTKHEEVKQNIDEEQTVSKALAEESGDERGHTSIAGEDVIDAMTAPDQSKNETENEKIQTSLEMVTEKIDRTASKEWSETIIRAKEDASIENQEESFDRKEKEDESVDNEAVRIDGIPKVEDLPPTELHAKTEIAEVENPNKNEDVLNAIHLLEKETLLVEGERLDKVSDFGPQDQIYETNEAAKDEEEHDDNDSQACESTMKPSLELPSEKGTVSTEPSSETSETEIETLSKVHKLDSEENLETTEAKKSMKEDIWEEACESEIQKLSTSDNAEKCHAEEANENIQAATPLKDEIEDDGKAKSIIDEEVTGIGEADDESNISDNVAHLSSEIIIQERDESPQQTEKQVDASKGEDTEAVSEESVKEGTVKNIQDDKNEIDKSSSREIFEESETAEKVDSISDESKQSDENPDSTPECSLVKDQESLQCINPIVEQASLAEEIDKDDECSMGKDQNTENYDRLAKAEEHNEVMLKGEGDSEHILRRNVPEENIEQPPISVTTEADASRQLDDDTVQDRAEEIENEEITNESNFRSLSQVTVAQDPAMDFQNNNKSAEKSDKEIPEECEAEGTGDNIAHEESPSEIIPAPLADKVGSNVSSESCDKDDTAVENQEESFTKKEIEEKSVDIDAVREDTLQNLENFPPRELNVNIEIAEVEISKKNADELNETRPLEQELKEISDFEPQDHVHKENEAAPYEEKHDESDSKACESINNTNLDQPFAEGAVTIEPSPETSEAYIAELEKVQKTNPEEKLKTIEAEMIVKEDVQKKEETCETEIHKLIKSDNCGNCHTEEVTSDKFCSTAFFSETVEQNFQVATLDKGPTSKDELDFNENAKSIISEEVTDEQNKRNNVMHLSSEVFNEETVKSPQQSDMEADIYKGEDIEGQIIGGNNVSDISHENIEHPMDVVSAEIEAGSSSRTDVEEVVESPQLNEREAEIEKDEEVVNENNAKSCSQNPAKDFHDNGINTEQSNIEIFEKSEVTETVDGIVIEAKESHESPNIVREQGNQQNQNLAIVEPSSIGKTDEDASPIKKNEDIQDDSELVKVDEHKVISVETEVGLSSQTNDNTVDEGVGSLKCNDRGAEIAKDEVANESNSKSLSKEAVAQDPVKNFLNDDNSAEKPNAEVCEKSETAEKVDSIVTKAAETDESPDLAKEQEILQIQNLSIIEASLEEKFNEDGISMIKDEDRGNEAQVPEVQKQNEVILMDKEGIEQILQKNESKENIGLPLNVESVETKASASSQIDDTTVEDRGEQPQRKVEDVINEINTESLSHESAAEVPVQNFQNDDINTEKSNTKIFEKSETAEIVASIVTEVIQSDESNNLFEEHESLQSQRATIDEASLAEEIDEDGSSIKKDEGRENSTELKEIEMTEVVFEGEKDLEKTLQKNEYESKENIESLEVISAETEAGATSQPDDTVKEEVEKPQCKETEVEMEKDENIINNSNDKSISQVSVAADPVDNFQIDDNSAENSKPELLMQSSEKCEAARTNEIILDETNQNGEIPCDTMSSSLAKEVDNKQDEESSSVGEQESMQSDKLTSPEASILDEKDESASSPKPDEEDDNNAESEELEVQGENETLKGKEDIQVVRQKFEMEPEVYKGEDTDGQIIEGNNTSGITQESVVEEPVKISQNDENNTKKSSNRKIFEKSDTAETVDCTTTEEKQSAESFNLVKHQESRQNENLTVVETSSTEKIYEDGSSIQKDKELANIEEHNEVILKGEEDLEQTVQKNNTKENIELLLNMVSADTEAGSSSRTDDNIVEEVNGSPQCNVKEAEIEKDAVVNESNTKSRSQDPIKNFNNDDTGAEQSNTESLEESDEAKTNEKISHEINQSDKIPSETISSSLAKEVESPQDECKIVLEDSVEETSKTVDHTTHEVTENNKSLDSPLQASTTREEESKQSDELTSPEASTVNEKDESGSSPKPDEENENNIESEELRVQSGNETLKAKEDLEEILGKVELGENLEQSITVLSAEIEAGTSSEVDGNPAEEIDESPQYNSKEAGMLKEKDDAEEQITDEQNFNSLSKESVEQEIVKNFQNEETNVEVSNKEIFVSMTSKTGESIALEMNQNNESPNASYPVVLIKEEEISQDKKIDPADIFPDEKKEDDESLFKSSEDDASETKLAEANENSKKEISHGEDNFALELNKKETGELLKSSPDMISAETQTGILIENVDNIIIPKEVATVQNIEEDLEAESQKNEPGELLKSSIDVIKTETKRSMLNDKDNDVANSGDIIGLIAIQNTEETVAIEKKEDRKENIDGSKVEKIPIEKDLKPAAEICDPSKIVENESMEERSMTSEMDVEIIDKTHEVDSEEKLEGIEMSKNKEEGIKKGDIEKVERDNMAASLSEKTAKHIIMEEETTIEISPQSVGEETTLIYGDQVKEKPKMEMHEELELTSINKDSERLVLQEENIEKDQPTEPANETEDDAGEVVREKEMHEIIHAAEDEDIRKQITEKSSIMEETLVFSVTAIDAEGPLEKEKEDENDTVKLKEEIKGFNSEVAEEIAARGNEVPKDTLKAKQQPESVLYPSKASEGGILPLESSEETKGFEQEDKRQLESSDPDTQEKEAITVNTKEMTLSSVDTNATQDNDLNLVEKRDHETPAEADQNEEDIEHQIQNKTFIAGNDKQIEIITGEMPLEKISDDNLIEHSVMSPTVSEVLTSGESKPIDENSANNTTANENTEVTLISSQATEPVYNEYEITTAEAVSKSQFIDTVIENTNEQAGSYQSEDLDRDLDNEQNISKQEYAEVSRTEDTGDLVGQQEFCRSKTSEDNEASNVANEVFKSMDSINADRKEAVLEEEDFAKKSEGSLKEDDAVEKAAIELEALAQNQEVETTEIKSYGYPTDENFESSEPAKKLDCTSEIMTRDLGNEIIQEMDQNKVAENSNSEYLEQNPQEPQESQQETEEKTEPKFEPEDHIEETQHGEETIKAAILTEEVHKEIEKADGGELVNQSNKEENNLKELEPVSIEDQRVDEVTESSCTSDEYLKATDSTEKTESAYSEVQETKTIGKENLNTKEEEEKEVEDAGAATALGFSNIAPKRNSEEVIKEQIVEETDGCYNKEKATIVMEATTDSNLEVQIDDKPVEKSNFPLDDSNSHAVEAEANQQDNMALGENSSNLASQLPTDDHENVQQENVAMNSADVDNMVESKRTSDVEHESKFHDMEELSTGEIRDEYEEAMKMVDKSQGDDTVASSEVGNNQTLPEEIRKEDETASLAMTCKEEEYETKVTTENSEENIVKVITTKDDSPTNSSALEITEERFLQNEKPRELEVCQLELEGKEGIPDSPNEEYEEKGGNLNEFKEESRGASETVSKFKCHDLEAATGTEVTNGQTPTEEQYQKESCASPSKEQELGSATTVEKTEESIKGEEFLEDETKKEEVCLQKEESREHQASELELNSPNEEQKEARATSVEIEDKKDDSESISESNSEGRKEPKEGETCSVQTNPVEKPQEQNQTPFSGTVSKEQEDETLVITESIEEKRQEMESMEETCLQKEEPRELEISLLQLQRDKTVQQERQTELYEREDEGIDGTQEEIKEVSELLPEPSSEEITAVAKYDFTSYHPLPTKISEERSQTSSAGLLSEVQEHGISTTAASIEEKKIGEPRELKSSQVESIDNDAQEKSLEEVHKAEDGIPNEPLKLQPEHENKERDAATTDLMAEENQSKRTTAATEFMHTEVTEEQIKEEKADTKNCHAITVDEAATKESCQEKKLKDEESLGDQELAKDVANEVLSKKMEKTNASGTTEEQISTEKGTVENLHQTFIENDTIKEHFPEEIGEHAEEAGRKLNNENWVNETITGDGKKESVTATEKELGVETSQKEITAILVEAAVSNPGIHQEKKTCDEISEYQKSREAEPERMISTFKKDVPQMLQETMEVTEVSAYAKSADSEAKRHEEEHGAECIVDEKAIEETMSKDSAKISLFDMMQRSTRERQASAELHGEKSKEERQTEETEKAKSDEEVEVETEEHEEEDEHKKNDSGSDAPVMVEASRDIDIKVGHKKSHNILSGVGSKVKHSIIKVKKAITGKSSHPKQQSPK
ncbi:extracellular matrix-binding protein EbhA isoform X7 [Ricinus communis]|uniref:extracellular matrix-binding protein EbhA isoform X7 n=1 Tax=Ricinus communis TaxID=3988 RepID=UPI00201ADD8A|nr:extracellular matrix-binding protein EbhA isoform X7 [Ricinus communis]